MPVEKCKSIFFFESDTRLLPSALKEDNAYNVKTHDRKLLIAIYPPLLYANGKDQVALACFLLACYSLHTF